WAFARLSSRYSSYHCGATQMYASPPATTQSAWTGRPNWSGVKADHGPGVCLLMLRVFSIALSRVVVLLYGELFNHSEKRAATRVNTLVKKMPALWRAKLKIL